MLFNRGQSLEQFLPFGEQPLLLFGVEVAGVAGTPGGAEGAHDPREEGPHRGGRHSGGRGRALGGIRGYLRRDAMGGW